MKKIFMLPLVLLAFGVIAVSAAWMIDMLSATGNYDIDSTNPNLTLTSWFDGGQIDTSLSAQVLNDSMAFNSPSASKAMINFSVDRDDVLTDECIDYENDCNVGFKLNGNPVSAEDIVTLNQGGNEVEAELSCDWLSCPQTIQTQVDIQLMES